MALGSSTVGRALAAEPLPDITPAPATTKPADTEKVWTLSKFIKGTASQVRDQINGETERLIVHYRATKNELAKADADYKEASKDAADRLAKDPAYLSLQTAVQQAEAQKQAQKEATPDGRLAAATRASHARQEADRYQREFYQKDSILLARQKALADAKENDTHCRDAIGKAQRWRNEMIDAAIRNTYSLSWPFSKGKIGLLNSVTPIRIDAEGKSMTAEYEAYEYIAIGKEVEGGIVNVSVLPHPVIVRIEGIDTRSMKQGRPVMLDQTFEMLGVERSERGPLYIARHATDDLEKLVAMVLPLREQIDPNELAALTAAAETPKKAHPRNWLGLPALLNAIPTSSRPTAHRRWDGVTVNKANDWLSAEAVGDKLETLVMVRGADPAKDGFFILHGEIEVPIAGGRANVLHSIDAKCPAAALPRIQKLRKGQKIKLSGTIRSIHIVEDGTTVVDLVEATL